MRKRILPVAAGVGLSAVTLCLTNYGADQSYSVDAYGVTQPRTTVDFATQIQPILSARCMPCHFPGGKMYDRLPFDQAKTIHSLGEKLFTRIKSKEEQRVIREFLSQPNE